ncbi:MAG: peptidoglycan DD-metalloendopeptidase family protein [Clostridia bacterium]|nr:peptidoglycan DD-metalloendopeptidase family protein [Clostridia bacterium]
MEGIFSMYLMKIRPYLKLISLIVLLVALLAVCLTLMMGDRSEIEDHEISVNESTTDVSEGHTENPQGSEIKETAEGYGLYIDGIFIATCVDDSVINNALQNVLNAKAKAFGAGSEAKFLNEFEIVRSNFDKSTFVSGSVLEKMLGYDKNGYVFEIKSVYGVTDLVLDLSYKKTMSTTTELEFDTVYLDNDGKTKKYKKVLVDGENGSMKESFELVYLNDKLVEKILVEKVVLKEPVSEVVERGVMISSSMTPASLKIFSVPLYGVITSPYEWRDIGQGWKFHEAIDISGPNIKGKEVIAAGDGEVVKKYYSWGYGNRIEILHPNGMITSYSHLNEYLVEVGDTVKEGQAIGIVGSTGNSTGTHLHFEVIIDGEKVNPVLYLKENLYEDD